MNTHTQQKPSRTGILAICLFLAAQVIRTVTADGSQGQLHWYIALILVYLVLFAVILWRPCLPSPLGHLYMTVQSVLIFGLLSLNPDLDHVVAFYLPLSFQVAFLFTGRTMWLWTGVLTWLVGGPLMLYHGPLEGLA